MVGDWETLQEQHTIKAHALAAQRFLEMAPNLTPPPLTWLYHAGAFAHVMDYVRTMCALIGPQHSYGPINWNHYDPSPSSSIGWGWPPPFCW
jgi:hypothetical protein